MSSKKKTMIGAAMGLAAAVVLTSSGVGATPQGLCIAGCNSLTTVLANQVVPVSPGDPAAGTRPRYSAGDLMTTRKACLDDCEPRFPQPKPPQQYPGR